MDIKWFQNGFRSFLLFGVCYVFIRILLEEAFGVESRVVAIVAGGISASFIVAALAFYSGHSRDDVERANSRDPEREHAFEDRFGKR